MPRRYPARARVVDTADFGKLKPQRGNDDVEYLGYYVDKIEKGPDAPITLTREGTDAMLVHAKVEPGQSILVQETYDPAWHATSGGQSLAVRRDVMGFMWIDVPPGDRNVRLEFLTPLENRVGQMVTLATLLVLLALALFTRLWERLA